MMKVDGKGPRLALAGVALALVAAACGGNSSAGGGSGDGVSGEIVVSGSSTVEPISSLVAEKFQTANPDVSISVDGPGTSDGFELFCNGETDISDASRAIEQEEVDACKANGIEFVELKIAIDGLSVITSHENNEVQCLDFKDLYALLGPESEGFENWSDANELAQKIDAPNAPYPNAPLEVTAPGEESGTFDSFVEIVLEGTAEERGVPEDDWAPRPDYQASANDNVIIEGISGSPTSLGWVGYAFFIQNEETVKALAISEGGGECIEPTPETISSGDYPIARDLFIYVKKDAADNNDAVASYVDFYLSEEGLASVSEVGYVDLAEEDVQTTVDVWEAKETGTREAE
ncbi:MAG: phosphate ABC transporter substrate-binding protein PstS family protein [Actinomycetota bacterium]